MGVRGGRGECKGGAIQEHPSSEVELWFGGAFGGRAQEGLAAKERQKVSVMEATLLKSSQLLEKANLRLKEVMSASLPTRQI